MRLPFSPRTSDTSHILVLLFDLFTLCNFAVLISFSLGCPLSFHAWLTMDSETSSHTLAEGGGNVHTKPDQPAHWRVVASHSLVTEAVLNHRYHGAGTEDDPYVVDFIPHDPRNPMGFSMIKKWAITLLVAFATLAVAFVSSAYTGGIEQVIEQFGCSEEVATLGVSLFVLVSQPDCPVSQPANVRRALPSVRCYGHHSQNFMVVRSSSAPLTLL